MGINFQEVTFKYFKKSSKNTLNNINLNINNQDEFIAILGHTGSGKSTLVQLMNALQLPTTGMIKIDDRVINQKGLKDKKIKLKTIRKHVGLVFQFPEYQLFEDTVLKDIMFGPKNFGLSTEEAKEKAIAAAKSIYIDDDILKRSPFNLSGGQMRRVAIAGILASDPQILILDEPTVGLDPKGKIELMELLVDIQEKTHKTIIMISHDMNVVARYATRTIVLDHGNLVFDGPKRKLFSDVEMLHKFNLDLPECAKIALKLKNKGIIEFSTLPLTKDELYNLILKDGDSHE